MIKRIFPTPDVFVIDGISLSIAAIKIQIVDVFAQFDRNCTIFWCESFVFAHQIVIFEFEMIFFCSEITFTFRFFY